MTKQSSNTQASFGRMELAQSYFPFLLPRSAWQKLKALMREIPELSGYVKQKRRTFLPSEVNIIYQPWAPIKRPFFRPFRTLRLCAV